MRVWWDFVIGGFKSGGARGGVVGARAERAGGWARESFFFSSLVKTDGFEHCKTHTHAR